MATYFTDDFADFATDWTERFNTTPTWSVTGGDIVYPGGSGEHSGLSWNDVDDGNTDNCEVLGLWRTTSTVGRRAIFVRGQGSGGTTQSSYHTYLASSAFRIYKCVNSGSATQVATVAGTWSANTDYWIRLRANGTSLKARIWADGGSEPGTWDLDTTDSSVTGTGWAGAILQAGASASSATLKQLGVGTNGDTAPASAVTATSFAARPQFPMAILHH